uniref:AMP-binding domain-containing protein n=1 Tax=Parastrongyloides trichosuri TaxID=131310 RepID=A0A0N4ZLA1_PARTI
MNFMYQRLMRNFISPLEVFEVVKEFIKEEEEVTKYRHQYMDIYQWPTYLEETISEISLGLNFDDDTQWNENTYFIHWEGCYRDSETADYFSITGQSFKIVCQKVCILFEEFNIKNNDIVCMFSPPVLQLPIVMSAAISRGIVFAPMSPESFNDKIELINYLKNIPILPKAIITVDTFFDGKKWVNCKDILDDVINSLSEYKSVKIFVIRHGGPHPGVPPPSYQNEGRRPNYKLQINMIHNKDYKWGKLMEKIKIPLTDNNNNYIIKKSIDNILYIDSKFINTLQFNILISLTKKLFTNGCSKNRLHFIVSPSDSLFFVVQLHTLIKMRMTFLITECLTDSLSNNLKRINEIFVDYNPSTVSLHENIILDKGDKEIFKLINSIQKIFVTGNTQPLDGIPVNNIIYS